MHDEAQKTEEFEAICGGVNRANRLFLLHKNTHDNRTALDKLQSKGKTREEAFRAKALRDDFTEAQIDALLDLQQGV